MRVYIKGFKSIADGQYVGLGNKLTFLVGPNSAGKSVLLHALQKLSGTSPLFEPEDHLVHHNISNDKVATSQALGVEWDNNEETIEYRATMFDSNHFFDEENFDEILSDTLIYKSIEENIEEKHNPTIEQKAWCLSRIINNRNIIHEVLDDRNYENFQTSFDLIKKLKQQPSISPKDFFSNFNLFKVREFIFIQYSELPEKYNNKIEKLFEWIRELIIDQNDPKKTQPLLDWVTECEKLMFVSWNAALMISLAKTLKGKKRQYHLNQFTHHNAAIISLVRETNARFFFGYPGNKFKTAVVSADRTLPKKNDLEAEFHPGKPIFNPYHELIKSIVAKEWGHPPDRKNTEQIGLSAYTKDISQLSIDINKHLSDALFIDNGYQVNARSRIKLSKSDILEDGLTEAVKDNYYSTNAIINQFSFDANIYITDAFGRELDFNRIGSGIGYVFPVLIECLKSQNAGGIVFIQQPELHLHPALQASLCDILIESAADRMIISETHSEHLILRALKRIRQTYNQTILNKELQLFPEDVAINYFEPMPDGTTRVHNIRIAPDGEFVDRWPNGFFPERDQELFDE